MPDCRSATINSDTQRQLSGSKKTLRTSTIDTIMTSLPAAASKLDCRHSHPDCRATAIRDLEKFTQLAARSARRFLAACSLLQNSLPAGCSLPRGFIVARDLELSAAAVEAENAYIVGAVRSLVRTTVAFTRGEELDRD
jgi:hypothetical protein